MAKDIVVTVWCDRHMGIEERVEGKELPPMTIDGKTKTLDLCDACTKEFVTPLAQLLDEFGATPEYQQPPVRHRGPGHKRGGMGVGRQQQIAGQARRGRKPQIAIGDHGAPCIWCGLDFSAHSGSGYMRHIKVQHGYANAVEAFGTTCPICGAADLRMMMSHVHRNHSELGFTHTAQAVDWAHHHGDPHGVYAACLSRKPSLDPGEAWETTRARERTTRTG